MPQSSLLYNFWHSESDTTQVAVETHVIVAEEAVVAVGATVSDPHVSCHTRPDPALEILGNAVLILECCIHASDRPQLYWLSTVTTSPFSPRQTGQKVWK